MAVSSLKEEIIGQLDKLSLEQQQALLDYAQRLQMLPDGTPGNLLLEHVRDFDFEPGEVDEMMRVIEEGCERIA